MECSANLGGNRFGFSGARNPIRVKMLNEDLILYRDASGTPGLLAEHCSHRGTSLYYGRVEESCIRCIYHGWAYDREGNVVDQPGEPPDSNFKYTVKHPAYPCMEVGGLIFAYIGPPQKQPPFPKYPQLFRQDGVRVTGNGGYIEQCNVFQALHDNNLDPWHGEILHGWFRGQPPRHSMQHGKNGGQPTPIKYERTPWGTRMVILKDDRAPGRWYYHETHTVWPTQRCNFERARSLKWAIPIDDCRTRWFEVNFYPFDEKGNAPPEAMRGHGPGPSIGYAVDLPLDWAQQVGAWWNLGHPWRQGNIWEDEVAQQTQGSPERNFMPDWEKWHLATTDRGLLLNREVWRDQIDRVREGLDPIGIIRDPVEADKMIPVTADDIYGLSQEEGMQLFNLTPEQRLELMLAQSEGAGGHG